MVGVMNYWQEASVHRGGKTHGRLRFFPDRVARLFFFSHPQLFWNIVVQESSNDDYDVTTTTTTKTKAGF
jgi:hypothetical protein